MDEAEWLGTQDVGAMLERAESCAGQRKLRLFACACARHVVPLGWMFDPSEAVAVVEWREQVEDGLEPARPEPQFLADLGPSYWVQDRHQFDECAEIAVALLIRPPPWYEDPCPVGVVAAAAAAAVTRLFDWRLAEALTEAGKRAGAAVARYFDEVAPQGRRRPDCDLTGMDMYLESGERATAAWEEAWAEHWAPSVVTSFGLGERDWQQASEPLEEALRKRWEEVKEKGGDWPLTGHVLADPDVRAALDRAAWPRQADALRDVIGNPFRPRAFRPGWRTETARLLARQMYESRDFSAMPVLADALEDAGCADQDVLGHCRGLGPHTRGCWVVDWLLGNE